MQQMPDKEFDNLFKNKFEDAEIEPSANLWSNIEKQLEPKKKRTIPIYWMAAAAVTLSLSALLVFQKKEVIRLHGADTVAQVERPVANTKTVEEIVTVQGEKEIASASYATAEVAPAKMEIEKAEVQEFSKNSQVVVQPNPIPDRLLIKPMDAKPLDIMPANEVLVKEDPIVMANIPANDSVEDSAKEQVSEKRGIRNVGDLVNFVVDKVDKREKKLVRFNTDDDDNSSIVGINIGFLKFNKKDK